MGKGHKFKVKDVCTGERNSSITQGMFMVSSIRCFITYYVITLEVFLLAVVLTAIGLYERFIMDRHDGMLVQEVGCRKTLIVCEGAFVLIMYFVVLLMINS